MKCKQCKTKFKEIKYHNWLHYFCSQWCKEDFQEWYIQEQKKTPHKANKPINSISKTNKNTPAKFTTKTKWEMLKRDWACIICRSRNNIEYHHCYYWGQAEYWEDRNDLNKWVCLCHKCHHEIHHWNGMIWQALRERCKDYLKKL